MKDILEFLDGGGGYIFEYEKDYSFESWSYEVVGEGVLGGVEGLGNIGVSLMGWWSSEVLWEKGILLE